MSATLAWLNQAPVPAARAALRRCCGASAWVQSMVARRPFRDRGHLMAAADEAARSLGPDDWLQAFAQHPRIGEVGEPTSATRAWSAAEQSGAASASAPVRQSLAAGNRRYAERFGYGFIVCATGKSAGEMLAMLESRLGNDRESELAVAAGEQMKITRIRLDKLLAEGPGGDAVSGSR